MSNVAIDWVRDHGGRRCGSNADVAVLMLLADRANDYGVTWVTHDALVECLPTSRRQTISEACKRLIDAEVVDAFTVNRGARTRQLLRVGAGALGVVPPSVSLPEWCRWTDLPTGWTSSTPERTGDAQASSTVESAGTSTVERDPDGEAEADLQHAQAYASSTVKRDPPARLSVPNPTETPQGTPTTMASDGVDGEITGTAEVDGFDDPIPVRTRGVPLTDVLLSWAERHQLVEPGFRTPIEQARTAVEIIGGTVGKGKAGRAAASKVCIDYLLALGEERITDADDKSRAIGMVHSAVANHYPTATLDALSEAFDRGAGITGEAKGLTGVTQYALAILRGDKGAAA